MSPSLNFPRTSLLLSPTVFLHISPPLLPPPPPLRGLTLGAPGERKRGERENEGGEQGASDKEGERWEGGKRIHVRVAGTGGCGRGKVVLPAGGRWGGNERDMGREGRGREGEERGREGAKRRDAEFVCVNTEQEDDGKAWWCRRGRQEVKRPAWQRARKAADTCSIHILDASDIAEKVGVPRCHVQNFAIDPRKSMILPNPKRLGYPMPRKHSGISATEVYQMYPWATAPHYYAQSGGPYYFYRALANSTLRARDIETADAVFVYDYCYMIW